MIDLTHHPFTISCMGTRERNTPGGEARNLLSLFRKRDDAPYTSSQVSSCQVSPKRPRSEPSDELVYYGPENRKFMTMLYFGETINIPMSGIPRHAPKWYLESTSPIYSREGYATTIEHLMFDINSFLVTDKDGCRIWTGPLKYGKPSVKHHFFTHTTDVLVGRFLYMYSRFKKNASNMGTSCGKILCCHISHIIPRIAIRRKRRILEEVWVGIEKQCIKQKNGCLRWNGVGVTGGSSFYNGRTYHNHLISYMANKGEIPKGLICRHMCTSCSDGHGTNLCLAPDHLQLGTTADNNRDKTRDGTDGRISVEIARAIKLSRFSEKKDIGYESGRRRAKRYGVSPITVARIDNGILYPELPDRYGKIHTKRYRKLQNAKKMSAARARVWDDADYDHLQSVITNQKKTYTTDKNKSRGVVKGSCWEHCCKGDSYTNKIVLYVSRQLHIWACMSRCHHAPPAGRITRHLCGNPKCFNPEHLKFGTNADNGLDSILHSGSKGVTFEKAVEIRENGKVGTYKEMCEKYNVSYSTISNILRRRTWNITLDHLLL